VAALASSLADHAQWLRMDDPSAVGAARRLASELAAGAGFGEDDAGVVLVVVSEIASNLVKHAIGGDLLLRVAAGQSPELEIVAADKGPGIADLDAALRDGTSSGGTYGVGLGAVVRLSTSLDIYSDPSIGTVMAATYRAGRLQAGPGRRDDAGGFEGAYGAVVRTYPGETVSGDGYAVREDGSVLSAMLCDGLGHGPLAERATSEALRSFLEAPFGDAPKMLEGVHRSIGHTRGAAAAVVQTTFSSERLRFAGVGNIAGLVDDGERTRAFASQPGIVGHEAHRFTGFDYVAPLGSLVVLHSDGLTPKWSLAALPGIRGHSPLVVAAGLLRVAGTRSDDASAMVIRIR
jgi:anti-sigma regulatory factor (Ser/Thr protein kinase)